MSVRPSTAPARASTKQTGRAATSKSKAMRASAPGSSSDRHAQDSFEPARWRVIASLLLAMIGVGISSYLTAAHFIGTSALACPATSTFNCEAVTTSPESHILGIPVAVLGLAFYVVMTAFNLPVAWYARDRRVHLARLFLSIAGMAFVLYLISAELLIIHAVCVWCTSVHFVTFLLLLLTVTTVPAMLGWNHPQEFANDTSSTPRRP